MPTLRKSDNAPLYRRPLVDKAMSPRQQILDIYLHQLLQTKTEIKSNKLQLQRRMINKKTKQYQIPRRNELQQYNTNSNNNYNKQSNINKSNIKRCAVISSVWTAGFPTAPLNFNKTPKPKKYNIVTGNTFCKPPPAGKICV